jgi:hypothetical protein
MSEADATLCKMVIKIDGKNRSHPALDRVRESFA